MRSLLLHLCACVCLCVPMYSGDVISTAKLEEALEALKGLSGEAKTRSIVAVLDEDHDGNINLDEIAEVMFVSSCHCLNFR